MKMTKWILVTLLAMGYAGSVHAQFGGLGKLIPGAKPAESDPNADTPMFGAAGAAAAPTVSMEDLKGQLDQSILEVGLARKSLLEAQWLFAGALGLKEEADKMLSGAGVLKDGKIVQPASQAEIADACNVSRELNEKLKEVLAGAGPMNEKQKLYYMAAKKRFATGLVLEGAQIAILVKLGMEIKDQAYKIKTNPLAAGKMVAMGVPAVKLGSLLPGDVKEMYSCWSLIRKVGADNNIEVEDIDVTKYLSGAEK